MQTLATCSLKASLKELKSFQQALLKAHKERILELRSQKKDEVAKLEVDLRIQKADEITKADQTGFGVEGCMFVFRV